MRPPATNLWLSVTVVVIFLGVLIMWVAWTKVDKAILTAIIAASGTILTSVLVVVITQHNTKLREIEEAHRVPKTEAYDEVTLLVTDIFKVPKIKDEKLLEEHMKALQERYSTVSRKLIVWASADALREWLEFKQYAKVAEQNPSSKTSAELLLHLDDVIRAIRADLGLENKGVNRGGFVKTFLVDPAELDRMLGR